MESIDNLRRALRSCRHTEKTEPPFDTYWITTMACDKLIDDIEQELADRYIELPVDADGVPWHIGDVVDGHGVVRSMDLNRHGWSFLGLTAIDPAIHRHAKPRTLEDVLREFAQGVNGQNADFADLAAKKYADEIRELLEVAE